MAAVIRCRSCGAPLEFVPGKKTCFCKYCGTPNTLTIPENAEIYNTANELRNRCEFDRAIRYYEDLIAQEPEDAESYFGLVLCKYGIEYVQDPYSGKRIPTCRRLQMIPMAQDEDYKKAIQYADGEVRRVYEEECAKIDKILARARIMASNGEKFDVFISYKESEEDGSRTEASVIAQDLYERLSRQGYRVFFSRKTLEDMAGLEYEPVIYSALHSAKVMLLLGTRTEQFQAVWVKNEWSRYLARMNGDPSCRLIPLYKDMNPEQLPDEVKSFQAIDMNHIGFEQDVTDAVGRLVRKKTASGDGKAITLENIRRRGYLELEKRSFSSAKDLFEQALLHDPKDWESYLGKTLSTFKREGTDHLVNGIPPVDYRDDGDYKMAKRFAPAEKKKEMEQWEAHTAKSLHDYGTELCRKGFESLKAGDFDAGRKMCRDAIQYIPKNPEAYLGVYLGEQNYRSAQEMAKSEQLPTKNSYFYKAVQAAQGDARKKLEGIVKEIQNNIRRHEQRDIAASWKKVLLTKLVCFVIFTVYCTFPIHLYLFTSFFAKVDEGGTLAALFIILGAVCFLGPFLLPFWIIKNTGPAVYEKIKRKKEDGTWERVIGPKIELPGEKFRMAVHVLASIVFLFAWYMVYVWICLYKLEN